MKYRQKLIQKIRELQVTYNLPVIFPKTKHKDLQRLINQVFKLTGFLDSKHITLRRLSVRIYYIENNLKSVPKCKQCEINAINIHKSIFCSNKCQKNYFDINETDENKLKRVTKAAQSRDYKSIHIKGNKTKKENPEIMEKYREKLNITLNTICENGLTIAQNRGAAFSKNATPKFLKERADKAAISRKENSNNSSLNYWSILSDEEKTSEVIKRVKKGIATKIEKGILKPIEDRDAFKVYELAAGFKHGFETKCEEQKALLKEYGVFNTKDNTKGCVRDHLLSRRYGFDNNIDPEIISHSANCEIVLHSENIRRAFTNDNLITLDELLERIKNWID